MNSSINTILSSAEDCDAFGLKINIKKAEVLFQPNSTTTREENINVDDTTLNHVQEFTYLDSIIVRDDHIDVELEKRMSKASMSFWHLREITTMYP